MYIVSQILALAAIFLTAFSSAKKLSRKALLIFNIAINVLNATHYLLLGGNSGAACSILFTVMLTVYYFKGQTKLLSSKLVPVFFGILFTITGILTYQNPASIIPIIGHLLLVVAFWMDTEIRIKEFCIIVAILWIIYNIILKSVVNVCGQSVCFVTYTIYVVRYHIAAKKSTSKEA